MVRVLSIVLQAFLLYLMRVDALLVALMGYMETPLTIHAILIVH